MPTVGLGLSKPPEGVLTGESVPRENEEEAVTQAEIGQVKGVLKARGEPYVSMSDSELAERAREVLDY